MSHATLCWGCIISNCGKLPEQQPILPRLYSRKLSWPSHDLYGCHHLIILATVGCIYLLISTLPVLLANPAPTRHISQLVSNRRFQFSRAMHVGRQLMPIKSSRQEPILVGSHQHFKRCHGCTSLPLEVFWPTRFQYGSFQCISPSSSS